MLSLQHHQHDADKQVSDIIMAADVQSDRAADSLHRGPHHAQPFVCRWRHQACCSASQEPEYCEDGPRIPKVARLHQACGRQCHMAWLLLLWLHSVRKQVSLGQQGLKHGHSPHSSPHKAPCSSLCTPSTTALPIQSGNHYQIACPRHDAVQPRHCHPGCPDQMTTRLTLSLFLQVNAEVQAKMEALPLLEVELRLVVPNLVGVPDLLAPAPVMGSPSAEGDEAEPKPASVRPGSAQATGLPGFLGGDPAERLRPHGQAGRGRRCVGVCRKLSSMR